MEREVHICPGCALPSEAFCRTGGEVVPIAAGKKATDRSETHIYPGCALPSEALGFYIYMLPAAITLLFCFAGFFSGYMRRSRPQVVSFRMSHGVDYTLFGKGYFV